MEVNKSKYEDTKVELKDNIDEKISDMSDSIYAELSTFRLWADTQFSNVNTELSVLLFLSFINIILSAFILIRMGLR